METTPQSMEIFPSLEEKIKLLDAYLTNRSDGVGGSYTKVANTLVIEAGYVYQQLEVSLSGPTENAVSLAALGLDKIGTVTTTQEPAAKSLGEQTRWFGTYSLIISGLEKQ